MKIFSRKSFLFVFVLTAMVMLLCFSVSAEREGSYTYTVSDGKATITDVDKLGRLDIVIPSTLGGYPVTQIGDNAFDYNVYIKSVTIPDGVTSIGKRAFADCDNLKKVTIPASVKTIGEYAFYDCVKLTNVIIPNGVTTIEAHAFYNCDSIISITIPESVTNIGGALFVNCDNIKEVLVDENNQSYVSDDGKILFNKSKTLLVQYLSTSTQTSYSIPDGVVTVGDNAFYNCINLNKITLPEGVATIGEYAFSRCSGLTDFIISDSVTTIGKRAFSDCNKLEQITIGSSVTNIGKGAFESGRLHKVYAKDIESWLKMVFEDADANPMNGAEELYFGNQLATDIVIPDSITTIYDYAFYDCESLTSVTIPDSVTSVGNTAFCNCSNLESVTVGNGVKAISRRMFDNCKKLNEVILSDSVTTIEYSAFSGCGFESFTIPDSVTFVGSAAFSACNNLKRIEIPSSVVSLGAGAFSGTGLTEVIISEGVESIGSGAFENCFYLNGVKVPNSVTEIGIMAFGYFDYGGSEFEDCIEKNSDFTITAGRCSAAHTYAKKNGLKFIDDNSNEHSFDTAYTKGTFGKDGSKVVSCKCGESETETYPAVTSVTLSTEKYIYNGKNRTPKVTVKDKEGKALTKNVDYKLTVASKRAGIGRYTVKVTLIGNYEGTKNLYFYILPGTPTNVKSGSQTDSSIKLTWSKVSGAAGYKVYRYSPSRKAYVLAGTTTGTSYTVKKLLANTKYTFRVYAYAKATTGKVYHSRKYALVKTATCIAAPTVKLASTAKGRATVAWSDVAGETGYQLFYSTEKSSGYKRIALFKAGKTKCYVEGLTSTKTYYFRVRAYTKTDSGYVYSPFSAVKSVKIK